MDIVFNILVIFLVLLIAYWWANQGVFSAIIHLLCVIVAGAMALALWEPLTVGVLLNGGFFDSYAWGVSLVGLFVVFLAGLRLATNKLVPANVNLPHWANLVFGFPVGAAAGVLTIGILLMGAGMIQTERELLGYVGWGRDQRAVRDRAAVADVGPPMWLPAHRITGEFYELLSVGAFRAPHPMRYYNPDLYRQAVSLIRDSAADGAGQVSMVPQGARVTDVQLCEEAGRCAVEVSFGSEARDFGDMLTITASQIRLVGAPTGGSRAQPPVEHPLRWRQETADHGVQVFVFDDLSHAVTSVAGQQTATVLLEFPWRYSVRPAFIQIKGTRFELPRQINEVGRSQYERLFGPGGLAAAAPIDLSQFAGARPISPEDVTSSHALPIAININAMPGGMSLVDRSLAEGKSVYPESRAYVSRELRIEGVYEPSGTQVVRLNVSRRTSSADIYGPVQNLAGEGATPMLVDSAGRTYRPIGYIHHRPDGVEIMLDPGTGIRSMEDLPHLPTSGDQRLELIFRVTKGVHLVAFKLGEVVVGTLDLTAQ